MVVLIPLAIWTVAGLIALWPYDVVPTSTAKAAPSACPESATQRGESPTSPGSPAREWPAPPRESTPRFAPTSAFRSSKATTRARPWSFRSPHVSLRLGHLDRPTGEPGPDPAHRRPAGAIPVHRLQPGNAAARLHAHLRSGGDPGGALAGASRRCSGSAFAGVILVTFLFPALVSGANPVLVGLVAASAILFVALFAAHGLNVATTTALTGSLVALLLIAASRRRRQPLGPPHRNHGRGTISSWSQRPRTWSCRRSSSAGSCSPARTADRRDHHPGEGRLAIGRHRTQRAATLRQGDAHRA